MKNKSRIRYKDRKKSKNERDVMSYEDMPLDDYEQEKTEVSPEAVKKIIAGICIAIVAGLAVFAFSNRDKLTWDNLSTWWTYDVLGNAGNGYPVNLVGAEVSPGNFYVSQGRIAYSSDTSFITLNSTGSEVADIQLRYSKPVMKSCSNRHLIFGIGGKGFQIHSYDKKLFSGETEENIYTGDISSDGVYCLVTEGNGYFSTLCVFDKNNNRIYKYSFSEYYITSVALNSDGTGCIASGVTSENGATVSGIYVLNFKHDKPEKLYKIKDDCIIDSKYLGGNRAVLIGQSASYFLKTSDDTYTTNSYGDKTLANYCFNTDSNSCTVALSRSGDGRSCAVLQYDNNGAGTAEVDTEYSAESISSYKNAIAILDDNKVYVYNTDGTQLYSADTGTGSKSIVLTSDSSLYLLSANQIRYFDLKNPSTEDNVSTTK